MEMGCARAFVGKCSHMTGMCGDGGWRGRKVLWAGHRAQLQGQHSKEHAGKRETWQGTAGVECPSPNRS